MKHFTCIHDVTDPLALLDEALALKRGQFAPASAGKGKTIGLIFLNPSLRTRMSTQKAAQALGMHVITANVDKESWALEFDDGVIMNGTKVEHIREAAAVIGAYCDIVGIRCFPSLSNRDEDDSEKILVQFMRHCPVPVISLESATRHPLQSLADMMTIREHAPLHRPKVVLTWAPHVKPVPQAVANSFAEWMPILDADFIITHPQGMELDEQFTRGIPIIHNQNEALENADFVYVKSWASYHDYGKLHANAEHWMLTRKKLQHTRNAKVMHCLPVRRDVELGADVLDSSSSLVVQQAINRTWAAQAVLHHLLEKNFAPVTKAIAQHV